MYPRILQVSGRSIEISQVIERTYEYLSQYISDGDDILGISTRVTFYYSVGLKCRIWESGSEFDVWKMWDRVVEMKSEI
ncbi:hypothetical protein PNOK_0011200 [Pyrrhoderma noxium]|uniref:Uncharacterized protein n=1 Tax=Pyrrhoderma noxium TaxID=2282107 RepID=A0A286UU99_9AGAM|nr:hypothetical protein PNOK_0011200 [Pyrrhoderma noxium]